VGKIAVCQKGIDFDFDISNQLLEWLLLAQEQGYGKINMYLYEGFLEKNLRVLK